MGKSVKIIGKNKWISLSARQKHTALSHFAVDCINSQDSNGFTGTYAKLISWDPIDRYFPPEWISKTEALELYFSFHQKLSGKPVHYFKNQEHTLKEITWAPQINISVILDQVLTPYNVGSILRIIDNFGFFELIHSTKGLALDNANLKKSAMGTEQWVPVKYEPNLLNFIKNSDSPSIALEKTEISTPITQWTPPETPFNIIIGNEAYGVSEHILSCCTESVHIPMSGYKNSMNLSHAFAIISFYISQFQKKN